MNILITGGAGFIGSHLCDKLLLLNHKIICVDNLSTGSLDNLSLAYNKYRDRIVFIKSNVCNYRDLEKIFKYYNIDIVYHCAAIIGVKRTLENPINVLKDIEGIKNVLNLSVKYKIKKVIYTSSSEIYGEPQKIPIPEESYINPKLTYGVVKLVGEKYCRSYYEKYNLKTCCVRLFNVYGPRQDGSDYGFVVARFIIQSLRNEDITIYGNGSSTRDFTYILDVVNCLIKILNLNSVDGEIINIGTGIRTSIITLAKTIIKLTNSKSKIKYLPQRNNDILNRCAKINKMKNILKYVHKYNLLCGLKKTIKWYRSKNFLRLL